MLHDENIASKIYLLFAKQLLQPPHSFSPMNERTSEKKSIRVCVWSESTVSLSGPNEQWRMTSATHTVRMKIFMDLVTYMLVLQLPKTYISRLSCSVVCGYNFTIWRFLLFFCILLLNSSWAVYLCRAYLHTYLFIMISRRCLVHEKPKITSRLAHAKCLKDFRM